MPSRRFECPQCGRYGEYSTPQWADFRTEGSLICPVCQFTFPVTWAEGNVVWPVPGAAPAFLTPPSTGQKYDGDKLRYDLIPSHIEEEVTRVLTYGALKYGADNWHKVQDADRRYFAAARRHMESWRRGEVNDQESGHPHLAHAICCLLFLGEFRHLTEEQRKG